MRCFWLLVAFGAESIGVLSTPVHTAAALLAEEAKQADAPKAAAEVLGNSFNESESAGRGNRHRPQPAAAALPTCVERTHFEGQVDCGNGAACPAGHRCATSAKGAGLRGLCQPKVKACDGKLAEATRGGPLNRTCFDARLDGKLLCGQEENKNLLANSFRAALPFECLEDIEANLGFECEITLLGVGIRYGADLSGLCTPPAQGLLFVDTIPSWPGDPWEFPFASPDEFYVGVPGLSFSIPVIGSAAGKAVGSVSGTLSALQLGLGLDACAVFLGTELCGADLTSSLPYYIVESTFDFGAGCGGGPAPPPPPGGNPTCEHARARRSEAARQLTALGCASQVTRGTSAAATSRSAGAREARAAVQRSRSRA